LNADEKLDFFWHGKPGGSEVNTKANNTSKQNKFVVKKSGPKK
jgi:hypothetical protein